MQQAKHSFSGLKPRLTTGIVLAAIGATLIYSNGLPLAFTVTIASWQACSEITRLLDISRPRLFDAAVHIGNTSLIALAYFLGHTARRATEVAGIIDAATFSSCYYYSCLR